MNMVIDIFHNIQLHFNAKKINVDIIKQTQNIKL